MVSRRCAKDRFVGGTVLLLLPFRREAVRSECTTTRPRLGISGTGAFP
jgi:hypothetical protein